VPSTVVTVQRN